MVAERTVRGHRGMENSLHWVLDDTFQEAHCRLCTGHAVRNMAALRRIALNFLTIPPALFPAKDVNAPSTQDGGPQPQPTGSPSWPCDTFANVLRLRPTW